MVDMVYAGGREQYGFAESAKVARLASQNEGPQLFGQRRAAGLARDHDLLREIAQTRREQANLR